MARKFKAKVVGIQDGDTVRLSGRGSTPKFVRIAGMNAPEKGQFGYSKAKRSLSQKVLGRTMTFKPVGKSYGRTVAKMPGLNRRMPPKGR
jgi:endonuclease YncB( thermonuclease family)